MKYGVDPRQLLECVIRPALSWINLESAAASALVLGTALTESSGTYLRQLGAGPALGLWQMEPATHDDILGNFVNFRPQLKLWLAGLNTNARITDGAQELAGNMYYGAALCRLKYARDPAPLPLKSDAAGMAALWKRVYNTPQGAGDPLMAVEHFRVACAQ